MLSVTNQSLNFKKGSLVKINLDKVDWVKTCIYFITALFLTYLFFICFIVKPNQVLFGNVFIKPDSIDFGGFGSLLAGIFSPLAFLWLVLNFRQQNTNLRIAEQNLEISKKSHESQNAHQLSEYSIQIISTYIEALKNSLANFKVNGKDYKLDDKFIDNVYEEYERLYKINLNGTQSSMMYCAINKYKISFVDEIIILRAIELQILQEQDENKRRNLRRLLEINLNKDLILFIRFSHISSDFTDQGYRDYIHYLFENDLMFITRGLAAADGRIQEYKDEISKAKDVALN